MRSESESTSVLPPLLLLLADSDPLLLLSLEEEEDSVLRCSTASDWAAAVPSPLGAVVGLRPGQGSHAQARGRAFGLGDGRGRHGV
ncbi:hypothetical protein APUTEX25_004311 [Auxenochlorella protothecoides]|uniref:Uncharacterized protein n=1 Tax=Auxenochlorella protothecoides TaxID=3075 RepID=A0A3M7L4H0_AUXPR|nr:hypothetical protein APUTEX25_004311 [Auxenochlorella protothecoides]|eukprot:RMZ57477.1 hypothetical protein APUTEX25_004311 [Auxenochlorella protothecoides]